MECRSWQPDWLRNMGLIIAHQYLLSIETDIMETIVGRGFANLKEFHQTE